MALQKTDRNDAQFLDQARRQAALREIEERFNLRLTEEEVFQAASLFFSLLTEGSFVNREAVTQEVYRQLLVHTSLVQEAKKSGT
jgi:hypothetical protein